MSIAAWIVIGILTGALASKLMPGKDFGGVSTTIIIGAVGALLGGSLGLLSDGGLNAAEFDIINIGSLLSAMTGAYSLLVLSRMITR